MRNTTARPARGNDAAARAPPKPKRASAPTWESQRAATPPIRTIGPELTGQSRILLPLQAVLRFRVRREDADGALIHLDRLVLLPAIVIQQRPAVVGQRFGWHLAAHPLLRHLAGQGR